MALRWEDERYVRLYTRDTATWKLLCWQAKCLLPLLLRKLDRAGLAEVGDNAVEGVAALTDMPLELVATAVPDLLKREVFALRDGALIMPNFLDAQEAKASGALRQREHRARARDFVRAGLRDEWKRSVVYFLQAENGGPIKIGHTDDLAARLVGAQTMHPEKLVVLATMEGDEAAERDVHARFAACRSRGEWFFPSDELMTFIRGLSRDVTRHGTLPVTPSLAVPSPAEGSRDHKGPAEGGLFLLPSPEKHPDPPSVEGSTRARASEGSGPPVCTPTSQKPAGENRRRKTARGKQLALADVAEAGEDPSEPSRPPTAATWDAYAAAYRERYGVEPVRNASVNGKLKNLVARLGADAAPQVAGFYVRHGAAYYAQKGHAVGPLLADAEKLHTEWSTGKQINAQTARREEQTAANPFRAYADEIKQKHKEKDDA